MRKGIAVSPGVAVGTAYCIHEIFVDPDKKRLEEQEITAELARYETARDQAGTDLRALRVKVEAQVGQEEAAIFRVHETILRDPAFTKQIRGWIVDDRVTASAALRQLLHQYSTLFARTKDEYLKERVNDLRDVIVRINAHLSNTLNSGFKGLDGPVIVVVDELLPSQVVTLGKIDVKGIVTQQGSQTSHAAIIARSRGIPAVSGVRGVLRQVKMGDTIVVDGRDGHVIVNADTEQLSAYRKLEREFFHLKDELAENRDQPAVSADGEKIQLLANINNLADADAARAMGAEGVGLYRTEYLYLTHPDVPDEEEQLEDYRRIIADSPGHSVTIRTLDIGGDKTVPYLGHTHQEANPFLGWRSIRLSFEHPEFFLTQIRAILRSAAGGDASSARVQLMCPMIATYEEMRRVKNMVRRAQRSLDEEGKPFGHVPVGMMLEVPAAAVTIDTMLGIVDFVSIGSNDLVQYLMAADRDNPKVNHLCQPLSPPVIRVLRSVIRTCRKAGKPVTVCGEMAGTPSAFVLLFGMGLRSFSMSPSFVPSIKDLSSHLTSSEAERILNRALGMKTHAQIRRYVHDRIAELAPNVALLDTT